MATTTITIDATLQPDGVTVQLEKKITLPPGRVTVTVQPLATQPGPTMLEILDRIHLDQQQRQRRPMGDEEIAAEVAQMRAEGGQYEERWRQIWRQTGTKSERTDNP